MAYKVNGKWKFTTYNEYSTLVLTFASALIKLGIN